MESEGLALLMFSTVETHGELLDEGVRSILMTAGRALLEQAEEIETLEGRVAQLREWLIREATTVVVRDFAPFGLVVEGV